MKLTSPVRVSLAEDIMQEAHRFSHQARGDRRASDPVADHRLLDQQGRCLGNIGETVDPPVFGPLEPTLYLDRHHVPSDAPRTREQPAARVPKTSAHRKEGVK